MSFIVIMNKVSLNYVQTACIFKYRVWNGTKNFFFFMSKFILVVFDILILKILFFNLKLWLTF